MACNDSKTFTLKCNSCHTETLKRLQVGQLPLRNARKHVRWGESGFNRFRILKLLQLSTSRNFRLAVDLPFDSNLN